MKVSVLGAGKIGGNIAQQLAKAGHEVTICFSRDVEALKGKAKKLGDGIKAASVKDAVKDAEVVVLSVLWVDVDSALEQARDLTSKVVVDVTNPFGPKGLLDIPGSVAQYHQSLMPGARLVRAFSSFTAEYQAEIGSGKDWPVAMFYCAEDDHAIELAAQLIQPTGFVPVYLGGWSTAPLLDAPDGMLLGKKYLPAVALQIAKAARDKDIYKLADLIKLTKQPKSSR